MADSKKRRTRRQFSDECKREAVELLQSSGATAEQVSAKLGISTSVLHRWSRELSSDQEKVARPAYDEVVRENRRLRRKIDFLKKATAYFTAKQGSGKDS